MTHEYLGETIREPYRDRLITVSAAGGEDIRAVRCSCRLGNADEQSGVSGQFDEGGGPLIQRAFNRKIEPNPMSQVGEPVGPLEPSLWDGPSQGGADERDLGLPEGAMTETGLEELPTRVHQVGVAGEIHLDPSQKKLFLGEHLLQRPHRTQLSRHHML